MNERFYLELLKDVAGKKVLLVGSTNDSLDAVVLRKKGKKVTTLDTRPGSDYSTDAHNMPFKDKSFDVAVCKDLMHHVKNPNRVLSEMKRVSANKIIVVETNHINPAVLLYSLMNIHVEWRAFTHLPFYVQRAFESIGLTPDVEFMTPKELCFQKTLYNLLEVVAKHLPKRFSVYMKLEADLR